jgi:hypothetical protein
MTLSQAEYILFQVCMKPGEGTLADRTGFLDEELTGCQD